MLRDMDGACNDWQKAGELGIKTGDMYYKQLCNK
jgi:hypothetical protein